MCLYLFILGCSGTREQQNVPEHIRSLDNVSVFTEADIQNADSLRLDIEQVFIDSDDNPIASFGAVATDQYGRLYIGDSQQRTVHVFSRDGERLGRVGRNGEGPGEFQWVGSISIQDSYLYAYDPNGRKVNLYAIGDDPGELPVYESDISITTDNWSSVPEPGYANPGFYKIMQDGDVVLMSQVSPLIYRQNPDSVGVTKYYRWNRENEAEPNVIFQTQQAKHIITEWFIIPPPFATREIMTLSGNEKIYSANTDEFLIMVHSSDGDYSSAFYYPTKPKPLTREEAVESVSHEQLVEAVESMELPEAWPVINRMFSDDENRLWISTIVQEPDVHHWWVLDESGELISKFVWPQNDLIRLVKGDNLFALQTDEETGMQQIVRYRIEL
jgi:hypothetical protein